MPARQALGQRALGQRALPLALPGGEVPRVFVSEVPLAVSYGVFASTGAQQTRHRWPAGGSSEADTQTLSICTPPVTAWYVAIASVNGSNGLVITNAGSTASPVSNRSG